MISMFNTGYDLQDQLDGVKNGIAIVSTNNTHIAITSGQYVYIQDHGTLAEGMYRATANIAANATLSSSNVTAVSGGGLNALNSKTEIVYGTVSASGITFQVDTYLIKIGHLVVMQLAFKPNADVSAWTTFLTLPEGFKPLKTIFAADLYNYNADRHYEIYNTSGDVQASFKMDANAQRRTSSIVWYV